MPDICKLRFSLVICTRNRRLLLERLLLAVAMLRYPEFELIIICDPDDIGTVRCLARRTAPMKIGHCPAANLAKARNGGLSMAAGDIVAFIDDDAVPEPDWLDRLAEAYAEPQIMAAGGFIRSRNGIKFQSRFTLIDPFGADHPRKRLPQNPPAGWFTSLTGTNFSVRRDAALAIGGFDEHYPYFLEETDFLHRLRQTGGEISIAEHAEVHHGYTASDIRKANGAPKSFSHIARSKAYFCYLHRRPEISAPAIRNALAGFAQGKSRKLWSYLLTGRLDLSSFARLRKELRGGIRDGMMLATMGNALANSVSASKAAFLPYLPHGSARRRLCVLTNTSPEHCPESQLIYQLAGSDYEVTVICFGSGVFNSVSFSGGIWLHRLSILWPWLFLSSFAVASELKRISSRRQFEAIHVAANDRALKRAAAASKLPFFKKSGAKASATPEPEIFTASSSNERGPSLLPAVSPLTQNNRR